jgi:hypothetical protein
MLVLNLCQKVCPDKTHFNLQSKLGDGADGEVFELKENNKVIKFGVLFQFPEQNIKKQYANIARILDYLKVNKPQEYAHVYEHEYLGNYKRPIVHCEDGQEYILYYYIMEKLEKISDDEKKVFHSILSHEDKNLEKNLSLAKIKSMLQGMQIGLDFSMDKVLNFCRSIKYSNINHNDIHPRNIMKNNLGQFKLIDFDRCTFKNI